MNPFRHFVVICVRYHLSHIHRVIQILLQWTLYQLTLSKDREHSYTVRYGNKHPEDLWSKTRL